MKIAVFGATGGTGKQVVSQALTAGHAVTALARTPAKLGIANEKLHVVVGDVRDPQPVRETLAGADAVVISLGNTPNNPDMIVSQGTKVILEAMAESVDSEGTAVSRLIVVSSLGVGDSKDQVPTFFKVLMKTALRKAMADKEVQEKLVRESNTAWTIVRPGGLTDGPLTGSYTAGADRDITAGQVSRADVAHFVLQQLTDDTYLRQTPAIS